MNKIDQMNSDNDNEDNNENNDYRTVELCSSELNLSVPILFFKDDCEWLEMSEHYAKNVVEHNKLEIIDANFSTIILDHTVLVGISFNLSEENLQKLQSACAIMSSKQRKLNQNSANPFMYLGTIKYESDTKYNIPLLNEMFTKTFKNKVFDSVKIGTFNF